MPRDHTLRKYGQAKKLDRHSRAEEHPDREPGPGISVGSGEEYQQPYLNVYVLKKDREECPWGIKDQKT